MNGNEILSWIGAFVIAMVGIIGVFLLQSALVWGLTLFILYCFSCELTFTFLQAMGVSLVMNLIKGIFSSTKG